MSSCVFLIWFGWVAGCVGGEDTGDAHSGPEGRYSGMGVLGLDQERFYMAGGGTADGFVADAWAYEIDSGSWTALDEMPLPLLRSAAVRHEDVVHMFGGTTSGRADVDVLLRWVPGEDTWETLDVPGGPGPRFKHMSVGHVDQMLVVGGKFDDVEPAVIYGDVWSFNVVSGEWTEISTTGGPIGIYRQAMAMDEERGVLWVHGGFDEQETRSDWLWSLDLDTWAWTRHDWEGEGPPERASHLAVLSDDGLVVWGGNHSDESVWVFEPGLSQWTEWALDRAPLARDAFVADMLPGGREILLVGGDPVSEDVPNFVADVWKLNLDDRSWTEIIPISD